jgi:hypothetical protein
LGNLYEIHRYLGHAGAAATRAAQLADAFERLGRLDEARRYRRQEVLVREGEPLNRVVAVVDGQRYEVDEPGALGDHIQFIFERNRITLQPARALTTDGERLGNEGRFDDALATFEAAAKADPFDPHCRYQAGLTLLHLGRYADAVASYEATEALAPGWFHCRSDLWLAQQLTLGQVDQETWLALQVLDDGAIPPHEKVRLAAENGLDFRAGHAVPDTAEVFVASVCPRRPQHDRPGRTHHGQPHKRHEQLPPPHANSDHGNQQCHWRLARQRKFWRGLDLVRLNCPVAQET